MSGSLATLAAFARFSTFPHKKVKEEHVEYAGINRMDTMIYFT